LPARFRIKEEGILDHDHFEEEEDNPLLEVTVYFCYVMMALTVLGVGIYELAKLIVSMAG
jgi:hypothetical protein